MTLTKKVIVKKAAVKDFNKEILDKLVTVLTAYKKELGDKKFEKKLNKISKLFVKGSHLKENKPSAGAVTEKKAAKKKTVKKKVPLK